jgi:hypothetical protein
MPQTIKYDKSHPAGGTPEARIASRLKNSGSPTATSVVQKGDGPTRTITNIHPPGSHGGTLNPGGPLNPMKGDR